MIECRNLVPETYNRSRDYQSILKLLDLVVDSAKFDIDNLTACLNPERCPSKLLPLLASYYGYEFDYTLSYEANRTILKYYPDLLRLRGSLRGLKLATVIAIIIEGNYKNTNVDSMLHISFAENMINIFSYFAYSVKLYDLLDVVRPAGYSIQVVNSVLARTDEDDFDQFAINDAVSYEQRTVKKDVDSGEFYDETEVDGNEIIFVTDTDRTRTGFAEVGKEEQNE